MKSAWKIRTREGGVYLHPKARQGNRLIDSPSGSRMFP